MRRLAPYDRVPRNSTPIELNPVAPGDSFREMAVDLCQGSSVRASGFSKD
jgi:hypothetical protein